MAVLLISLNTYIRLTEENPRNDIEIRCWQLSEELARLFREYEFNRSDMIQGWLADSKPTDVMEICQRWIYRKMCFLKNQLGQSTGRQIRSIAEYASDNPA